MDALDKTDLAMLARLQQDGRLANTKLAEELALSEASC
jgi:DNA-binding Lrp family transcriptional regulator